MEFVMIQNPGYVTLIWMLGTESGLIGEFDSEDEVLRHLAPNGDGARWAEEWELV